MEAQFYSDKSIAVFGDTRPWANNLKEMGGKYNSNLRGQPGWIFSRNKEAEIMQFIANANAGYIQPLPQAQSYAQPIPREQIQQLMSPDAAMQRLTLIQQQQPNLLPSIQPLIRPASPKPMSYPLQSVITPMQPRPLSPSRPQIPKPLVQLPPQPLTISFPNAFSAGDGLNYQVVIYTCPLPSLNQSVTLKVGDQNLEYIISQVKQTAPVDEFLISQVGDETAVSRVVIISGKWQVHCMPEEHSLVF